MSGTFKVGIVGAGVIGEVHAGALEGIANATVVAIAEPREEAGQKLADAHGARFKVTDPIIIGEILSPSTSRIDVTAKLVGYFTISSLHHYLVVDAKAHTLTHYHRDATGEVIGNVISEGILMLDPPGLSLDVGQVFEGLRD